MWGDFTADTSLKTSRARQGTAPTYEQSLSNIHTIRGTISPHLARRPNIDRTDGLPARLNWAQPERFFPHLNKRRAFRFPQFNVLGRLLDRVRLVDARNLGTLYSNVSLQIGNRRTCAAYTWVDRPDFTCFQAGGETGAIARGVKDELGSSPTPEIGPWARKR
jgi:hypothetical protein